eukprot:4028403-Prorocentrum_lima.AAC.1
MVVPTPNIAKRSARSSGTAPTSLIVPAPKSLLVPAASSSIGPESLVVPAASSSTTSLVVPESPGV